MTATTILSAQQVATVRLDKADARHPAEWTEIVAVRELKDGRVVVLDALDQAIKLVDLRSGMATMIGSKGNGPGEYQTPMALLALPADSSAIYDFGNEGRSVVIKPDGSAGNDLPGLPVRFIREDAQTDAMGFIYRMAPGSTPFGPHAIERLNRQSKRIDTVGFISRRPQCSAGKNVVNDSGPVRTAGAAASVGPRPFLALEQWTVAPDGRLAVVCPEGYRVVIIDRNGKRIESAIPFAKTRIGQAEKDAWIKSLPTKVAVMMFNRDGKATTGYQNAGPPVTPQEYPEFLPPFVTGRHLNGAAFFAPDGALWITRSVSASAPPTYDVIGRDAKLAYQVTLPAKSRVVGFGASGVYVVQVDEDDIQHLLRFRFPAMNNR